MKPNEIYAVFQSYKAMVDDPSMQVDKAELAEEFKRSLPPLAYNTHAKTTIAAVLAAFDMEIANGRTEGRLGTAAQRSTTETQVRGETRESEEAQESNKKPRGKQGSKLSSKAVANK